MKRLEPDEVKKPLAEIIFFPRHRIVRTILRGNRVYSVQAQEGWDDTKGDAPKSA